MVRSLLVFNMVDYLLLLIMVLCALSGLRQGFIMAAGRIITVIIGLALAFYYYNDLTMYMERSLGLISMLDQFLRDQTPLKALATPYRLFVPGFAIDDSLRYLAYWLVSAACFLLLLISSSQLLKLCFAWFQGLTSISLVSGINQLMGTVLALLQGIFIVCLLVGFTVPVLHTAAQTGFHGASVLLFHLNNSVLTNWLLEAYHWGQVTLGFEV